MLRGGFATKIMVRSGCAGDGDGAVAVRRQVSNASDGVECWVCLFALKIFGAHKGGGETPLFVLLAGQLVNVTWSCKFIIGRWKVKICTRFSNWGEALCASETCKTSCA